MINDFISLLFPRCCLISGEPLARGEQYIATAAARKLPRFDLRRANKRLEQRVFTFAPVKHALAYYKFAKHNRVQQILHHLKYRNCPEVGELTGMWFAHALQDAGFNDTFDAIIPVPLHRAKQRQRGYNQCDYLAKGMAQVLDVPWFSEVLVKQKATTSQTRKSRWERSENVHEIFAVKQSNLIANQRVLLVDDVVTTGATLGTAAKVLLNSGCREVSVAALAATEN